MKSNKSEWKEVRAITPARKMLATQYKIPLLIHQSHKSRHLPVRLAENIQKWVDMNPEFEHRYYDDEAMLAYVAKHGSDEFKKAFHKVETIWGRGAFQADLFRYLLLKNEGGVWIDTDVVASNPLLASIQPTDQYVVAWEKANAIYQSLIVCVPAHPFIVHCLRRSVNAILGMKRRLIGRHHLFEAVGPPQLRESIRELVPLQDKGSAPYAAEFDFEGQKFQYRLVEQFGISTPKYDGYFADLQLLGGHYWRTTTKISTKIYAISEPLLRVLLLLKSLSPRARSKI